MKLELYSLPAVKRVQEEQWLSSYEAAGNKIRLNKINHHVVLDIDIEEASCNF